MYLQASTFPKSISNFFKSIRPPAQWEGLHIEYEKEKDGSLIFNKVSSILKSGESLNNLKELSIRRVYADPLPGVSSLPTTLLSKSDATLLSKWQLTKLKSLKLSNVIPVFSTCVHVRELDFSLSPDPELGEQVPWDIVSLRIFLGKFPLIESLSLFFVDVAVPEEEDSDAEEELEGEPMMLDRLKSLKLSMSYNTEAKFLTNVMDSFEAPVLNEMTIIMKYDSSDNDLPSPEIWIDALFETRQGIRTFPRLETFSVSVNDSRLCEIPFNTLFEAVPRVQRLKLQMPQFSMLSIHQLKDLCSLHLKRSHDNELTFNAENFKEYFRKMRKRGELEFFEKLELEGDFKLDHEKKNFRRLLGDKFIWKN